MHTGIKRVIELVERNWFNWKRFSAV